jgi:serine beta-lactamase-like protein LACTB, mitochondrial
LEFLGRTLAVVFVLAAVVAGALLLLERGAAMAVIMRRPVHPAAAAVPSRHAEPLPGIEPQVEVARRLVRELIVEENLPGLSVAVGRGGAILWAEGFGWADVKGRIPVTPATGFRIGGVSQTLTAAAALLLHQRGRLDLDAPVQRYVPDFPVKPWPLTTRQLLAHAGGVRDLRFEAESLPRRHCDDAREGLEIFAPDPLRFRPGTRSGYSTHGYVLASVVVREAAGEPLFSFMEREVFAPMGMRDTVPDSAGEAIGDRAAFYHPRMFEATRFGLEAAPYVDYSCLSGAEVYLSTPSDLVRFSMGIRKSGLLNEETLRMMETRFTLTSGEPGGYSLGWFVGQVSVDGGATPALVRVRQAVGGTTVLLSVPSLDLSVALSANVSFAEIRRLADTLADLFAPRPAS